MKKIIFIFLILASVLFLINSINNNTQMIISDLIKKNDVHNGDLRYKIYLFGIFPVATAVLASERISEYNGQKTFHLNARAESLSALSKIFHANVALDSYIDSQKFYPLSFKQKISVSGKPDIFNEATYDQKTKTMTIDGVKRTILSNTQDPLSAIFNIKRTDFDRVKNIEMNLNTNQKNYILKGTAEQKELLANKVPCKIILAKAQIFRRDKNPYHKSKISIVFLKERENIPILIKVFAGGFLITAKLIKIEK